MNLVCLLPLLLCRGTWLTAVELRTLLVAGGVNGRLNDEHVRSALRHHNRGRFDTRSFGKSMLKYYRDSSFGHDPTMPDTRQQLALRLPSDFFQGSEFADKMSAMSDFFTDQGSTENTTHGKKKSTASIVKPSSAVCNSCRG